MCLWGEIMDVMRSRGWELLPSLVIKKLRPTWPAGEAAGLAHSGPGHHPHACLIAEASLSCPVQAPAAASVPGIPHSLLERPLCARLCAGH